MKKIAPQGTFARTIFLFKQNYALVIILILTSIIFFLGNLLIRQPARRLETVSVLVAKNNLLRGQTIKEGDLAEVSFVKGYVPENSITVSRKKEVVGKTVLTFLLKGDIITPHSFGKTLAELPIQVSKILKDDKKAFYLKRSDIATIPVGLSLSDRIDIFGVKKDKTSQEKVLENVEIIDIRSPSPEQMGNIDHIGLALTEEQIIKLTRVIAEEWFLEIVIRPKE